MSNEAPPAGWYPNPDGTGGLRWWSGIGWTDYTRQSTVDEQPPQTSEVVEEQVVETTAGHPTEVLGQPTAVVEETTAVIDQQTAVVEETTAVVDQQTAAVAPPPTQALPDQSQWNNPWGQPVAPPPAPPVAGYGRYAPPVAQPLTASGMRPLSYMFGDIGRIVRRAWLPILGLSLIVWVIAGAIMAAIGLPLVNFNALWSALDTFGTALNANPDGNFSGTESDQIISGFSQAFSALPPAGWAAVGGLLFVIFLFASMFQIAAVSRLSMDAAAEQPVQWGAAIRSGFSGGLRLFGYWLLIGVIATIALIGLTLMIGVAGAISPALAVLFGFVGFIAVVLVGMLVTGRLIPSLPQAVVGRRALSWSWQNTKGKFWGVLGRYLLWSIAASLVVQVILTLISIPFALIFLGQASAGSSAQDLGQALQLQLIMMPITLALTAVTVLGITPIWRDLTDNSVYRSIDDNGQPIKQDG